jgi:hypothetical protein
MISAPRPASTPPTEVARRQPCAVVSNSGIAARCGDRRVGKTPLVPGTGDDMPAIARQFVGEVLRIADAEDLRRRVVPETPGGNATDASNDFRWRGGRLTTRRRAVPSRTADAGNAGTFRTRLVRSPLVHPPQSFVWAGRRNCGLLKLLLIISTYAG